MPEYTLTITKTSTAIEIISTDNSFDINNLYQGDGCKSIDAYCTRATHSTPIRRQRIGRENKVSNQTLAKIALQLFEDEISALTDQERKEFPICRYRPNENFVKGIYDSETEVGQRFLKYVKKDGSAFYIPSNNVFSTIHFIKECLQRYGTIGDQFVLKYKKPTKKTVENTPKNNDESNLSNIGDEQPKTTHPISLNTILYGPPGTGKTYHTAIYAVAICNPDRSLEELKDKAKTKEGYEEIYKDYQDLINEGRVKFTTFHQSYGYEDFMEGIKPKIDDSTGKKDVYYEVEDGVFKTFCKKNAWFEIAWNQLVADANANNGIITVTWDAKKNPQETRDLKYWKNTEDTGYAFYDAFNEATKYHKATKDQVQRILEGTEEKPKNGNSASYNISCAVLKKLKSEYSFRENKVFIIDEINRGNISKIFGELITLIEDDKRERATVTLPYSGEPFTIPKNIYILGTMNTADRSIALMDTALRRRFTFVEMMPEPELFKKDVDGISICNLLTVLNERIKYLYDREHTIGHAYFKECLHEKGDIDTLWNIFKNKIIPLLQEYFYDDYEKIALVLGDAGVSDKMRFVSQKKVPDFLANTAYDEGAKYEINPEIWDLTKDDRVARLKAIYEKSALQSNETEEEI